MIDITKTTKTQAFFQKVKTYIIEARVELIIAVAVFFVDMISKLLVNIYIPLGGSVTVIPLFLAFTNVHNDGAAFGNSFGLDNLLGDVGTRVVLCIFQFAAAILFAIFLYKLRKKHMMVRVTLALLIAGALGNAVDRAVYGYVRDFVEIIYFGLTIAGQTSFYIWNIADAALIVGLVMAIISVIFFYKEDPKEMPETAVDESGEVISGILPDMSANSNQDETNAESAVSNLNEAEKTPKQETQENIKENALQIKTEAENSESATPLEAKPQSKTAAAREKTARPAAKAKKTSEKTKKEDE